MDLVEFLRARLDEMEVTAAEMRENVRWLADCGEPHDVVIYTDRGVAITADWVLADVQAKRAILALHTPGHECSAIGGGRFNGAAGWFDTDHNPCMTLLALTLPYVDHPDYQPEWKP